MKLKCLSLISAILAAAMLMAFGCGGGGGKDTPDLDGGVAGSVNEGESCVDSSVCAEGLICQDAKCAKPDKDKDGIQDASDNCIDTANEDQTDTDGDGIDNACDDKQEDPLIDPVTNPDDDIPPPPAASKYKLIVISLIEHGSVKSDPEGIDCGTTCEAVFDKDASIILTPTADDGYKVIIDQNKTCTANFSKVKYKLKGVGAGSSSSS